MCNVNFFDVGILSIFGKCINWMCNQMDRLVEAKKE